MTPPTPLTARERKLSALVLAALGLIVIVYARYWGAENAVKDPLLVTWRLRGEWQNMFTGTMPRLSLDNAHFVTLACSMFGLPFVFVFHAAHLLRRGRWLPVSTLWLWTACLGLFPTFNAVIYELRLPGLVDRGFHWAYDARGLIISWLLLGLFLIVVGFLAWRKRRWEGQAAVATAE